MQDKNSGVNRRRFLKQTFASYMALAYHNPVSWAEDKAPDSNLHDRVFGLLLGSLIGDALGGPIEFQEPDKVHALPDAPKSWQATEVLETSAIQSTAERLRLRGYSDLRPVPEPYGHWAHLAPPGTITDDSRHKMVLMDALRQADEEDAWPVGERELAKAYLAWPRQRANDWKTRYGELRRQWLEEIEFAARWTLGERNLSQAKPPERLWVGLPTCCGQMTLPPLACIFPGQPEAAYLAASSVDFIDNGFGRDMNCALVGGLAQALTLEVNKAQPRAAWEKVYATMRATDPYGYSKVPWSQRGVDRWLNFALESARAAHGRPAVLFDRLNQEFALTTKWEAQVPYVVIFAVMELCDYDPLAGLQLSVEWGHDTDSYAQLLGAFIGALYGSSIFPATMQPAVEERLEADYGERLEEWVALLLRLGNKARQRTLFER